MRGKRSAAIAVLVRRAATPRAASASRSGRQGARYDRVTLRGDLGRAERARERIRELDRGGWIDAQRAGEVDAGAIALVLRHDQQALRDRELRARARDVDRGAHACRLL